MSVWTEFAKLVGVAPRHAEDALHSERVANGVLSRRAMFSATGALAAGTAFGFPEPSPKVLYVDTDSIITAGEWHPMLYDVMRQASVMALVYRYAREPQGVYSAP